MLKKRKTIAFPKKSPSPTSCAPLCVWLCYSVIHLMLSKCFIWLLLASCLHLVRCVSNVTETNSTRGPWRRASSVTWHSKKSTWVKPQHHVFLPPIAAYVNLKSESHRHIELYTGSKTCELHQKPQAVNEEILGFHTTCMKRLLSFNGHFSRWCWTNHI